MNFSEQFFRSEDGEVIFNSLYMGADGTYDVVAKCPSSEEEIALDSLASIYDIQVTDVN